MDGKNIGQLIDNATKGFMPGDACWILKVDYEYKDCDFCNGEKLIAFVRGKKIEITCPKCKGSGQVEKRFFSLEKRKIDNIYLNISLGSDNDPTRVYRILVELSGISSYMGIGDLFKTEEGAKKEADRRNSKND